MNFCVGANACAVDHAKSLPEFRHPVGRDVPVPGMESIAKIIAGAERAPGAAQDDDFDGLVLDGQMDSRFELFGHRRNDGVEILGAIKRDRRDRAVGRIDERCESHVGLCLAGDGSRRLTAGQPGSQTGPAFYLVSAGVHSRR